MKSIKKMHAANRQQWEAGADEWRRLRDEDGGWRRCHINPEIAFEGRTLETIKACAGDLTGKQVCVVGSGDNYVAFALAGMGAQVISVDISERQLANAAARAYELGLKIRFLQADAADLHELAGSNFDLVCSSNGFFVWLADMEMVFAQIASIMKPGGYYVFYEVHPFQRPWKDQVQPIEMIRPYGDVGPHDFSDEGKSFEFLWTMADILNSLSGAGFRIGKIIESPAVNSRFWTGASYGPGTDERLQDWRVNPRAGLPVWLTVAAQKL
jgi:SAM-dependent methyltransferase